VRQIEGDHAPYAQRKHAAESGDCWSHPGRSTSTTEAFEQAREPGAAPCAHSLRLDDAFCQTLGHITSLVHAPTQLLLETLDALGVLRARGTSLHMRLQR